MVLLNTATKVYAGTSLATKVYQGAVQILPAGPSYGSAQTSYTSQTPANSVVGGPASRGADVTFAVPGRVTGMRVYRTSAGSAIVRTLRLWDSGGSALGSATTDASAGPGWKTATLSSPITVTAGQTVRVSYDQDPSDEYARTTTGGTVAIYNGDLGMATPQFSGTAPARPTSTSSVWIFVDLIFEKDLTLHTAKRNSFIGVSSGTGLTTGNSGGSSGDAFDKTDVTGGTLTVNTSADLTSAYDRGLIVSLAAATNCYASWTLPALQTYGFFRFYTRFSALPSADTRLIRAVAADDTTSQWSLRLLATGVLALYDINGVSRHQTSSALSTNTIYRVECSVTASTMTLRVYLGESTTLESMGSPTASPQMAWKIVRFGTMPTLTPTWTVELAALAWSFDDWLGPAV